MKPKSGAHYRRTSIVQLVSTMTIKNFKKI